MGYDGKGQITLHSAKDNLKAQKLLNEQPCVLEKKISFQKEFSVLCFRSILGETTCLPVVENIHHNGILHQSIVPAQISTKTSAIIEKIATDFVKKAQFIGTIAIEFFYIDDENILFNEIAPRPHNSGHFSIEACLQSQFELHIKSILGIPFGKNRLLSTVVMTNILGQHIPFVQNNLYKKYNYPVYFHVYGKKEAKENRKMGHITILGQQINKLQKLGNEIISKNVK